MNHLLACKITYQGKIEYGTAFGSEIEQALPSNMGWVEDIAFEIRFPSARLDFQDQEGAF
jgi:hypothetical protein